MKSYFSPEQKAGLIPIWRKYNFQVTSECADACRAQLNTYASDRSIRQWCKDFLKPVPVKRGRTASTETNEVLLTSAEVATDTTADSPPIDLSGLSRIEVLDRAIDRRLSLLVADVQSTSDSVLAKVVEQLMEQRRRELSIPTPVMAALGALGRLEGLIQRLQAEGELSEETTLASMISTLADTIEEAADGNRIPRLESGEAQRYERNPRYSDYSITELVAELDELITRADWYAIQAHEAWRFDSMDKDHVLAMFSRPRAVDDAQPELIALYDEEVKRVGVGHAVDLRSMIRELRDRRPSQSHVSERQSYEIRAIAPPVDVKAEPIEDALEPVLVRDTDNLPDWNATLSGIVTAQQSEMRSEITRLRREGQWARMRKSEKIMLFQQANLPMKPEDL